jgi:Fe-S cluster assembly ATP-binding protein
MSLQIKQLNVSVEDTKILKGIDLVIEKGSVHVIMGPNGSGKSTLANSIMGHPKYTIDSGSVIVDDEDITELDVHKKAKSGLFLSMQYPPAVEGVTLSTFLRRAVEAKTGEKQHPVAFYKSLQAKMKELDIDPTFAKRYVNQGFSGGEKKKAEILQLAVLDPTYAILDETDSGLDVDSLRVVADGINAFKTEEKGILLITHYNRILEYVRPDFIHIMKDGKIAQSGGPELAKEIEENGYKSV